MRGRTAIHRSATTHATSRTPMPTDGPWLISTMPSTRFTTRHTPLMTRNQGYRP